MAKNGIKFRMAWRYIRETRHLQRRYFPVYNDNTGRFSRQLYNSGYLKQEILLPVHSVRFSDGAIPPEYLPPIPRRATKIDHGQVVPERLQLGRSPSVPRARVRAQNVAQLENREFCQF